MLLLRDRAFTCFLAILVAFLHLLSTGMVDGRDDNDIALGALGAGRGLAASISNSSAMTMTDQTLRDITDLLENCENLERVILVGNSKLGLTGRRDGALADFIQRVGRKCTVGACMLSLTLDMSENWAELEHGHGILPTVLRPEWSCS